MATPGCVAVAVSGGRDSTALLHATVKAARFLGLSVWALHVHHGLNPQGDAWVRHLQRQCARWRQAGAPLRLCVARLAGSPAKGESVEAWARRERYAALTHMAKARGASLVLLAHHQRDQAETVVLQALRGAGAAGLAAMPRQVRRDDLDWARPWLAQPSGAIDQYIRRHRLGHIEDDSNADQRFARNRLRHALWPALLDGFPHAEASLADVARQAQREAALRDEVAAEDLRRATTPQAELLRSVWLTLSPARRWFCLRAWLHDGGVPQVSERLLTRLTDSLSGPRDAVECPAGQGWRVRLYRGVASLHAPRSHVAVSEPVQPPDFGRPGAMAWLGGWLCWRTAEEGGIAAQRLPGAMVRARLPGDEFQKGAQGTPRCLKKQFQAAGVARWERDGPVLVAADGRLLWVAGLGPDGRCVARVGEAGMQLSWTPGLPSGGGGEGFVPAQRLE